MDAKARASNTKPRSRLRRKRRQNREIYSVSAEITVDGDELIACESGKWVPLAILFYEIDSDCLKVGVLKNTPTAESVAILRKFGIKVKEES
jgi:hypothetical protein